MMPCREAGFFVLGATKMNRRSLLKFLSAIPALGVAACGGMRPVKAEALHTPDPSSASVIATTVYAEALVIEHHIDGLLVPKYLWDETRHNRYIAFGTANIHEYATGEGRFVRDLVSFV
jgi:hypothetical protein